MAAAPSSARAPGVALLPADVTPIWLEGIVTSDFESDTLPILFVDDEIYSDYYDTMCVRNPQLAPAIRHLQQVNSTARQKWKQENNEEECLTALWQCVQLRRYIFNEGDFQHTAAMSHFLMTLLRFATMLLYENASTSRKSREEALSRCLQLFKKAQEVEKMLPRKPSTHRALFQALVHNNFANYFYRRRRPMAAAQEALGALRSVQKSCHSPYLHYFSLRAAVAELLGGRFDEAVELLQQCFTVMPSSSSGEGNMGSSGSVYPPVRYAVELLDDTVPIHSACEVMAYHNMAVAQIGKHKHHRAMIWCNQAFQAMSAMQEVSGEGAAGESRWMSCVVLTRNFCKKMILAHRVEKLRISSSDALPPEVEELAQGLEEVTERAEMRELLTKLDEKVQECAVQQVVRVLQEGRLRRESPKRRQSAPKLSAVRRLPPPRPSRQAGLTKMSLLLNTSVAAIVEDLQNPPPVPPCLVGAYANSPKRLRSPKSPVPGRRSRLTEASSSSSPPPGSPTAAAKAPTSTQ
eukprot:RCo015323